MTRVSEQAVELTDSIVMTTQWGEGAPEVVLLHDGLGSVAQWRDVPVRLAATTGRTVLAFDRPGHGNSRPVPIGPWPHDWLHREAALLGELLDWIGAPGAALIGHSDGGSIAAIHATSHRTGPLALLAAHSWVEPVCRDEIGRMAAAPEGLVAALDRHHANAQALFDAWSGVWLSDEFTTWDIRPQLGAIEVPTLVAQGSHDEFATTEHVTRTAESIGANATPRIVDGAGHLLHHEAPDEVVTMLAGFLDSHR